MKTVLRFLAGVLFAGSALIGTGLAEAASLSLEAGFANPPDDAKLQVWWHWLTKSTTKKGVDADLRAMKEMEISTAHVFVPGFSGMPDQTGKILTPEWMDVFKYAIERANHYGIKLGFHNCPGWSASGGPWITADNSMQVLAASALDTELASGRLKLPDPPRKGFYEDVAVFAFPADAKADVAKVTSDFGGDVEGFRAGKATLAPPVAKGEKGGTVTVEYAAPVKARFIAFEFDCRHLFVGLTVEGSADGREWKRLCGSPTSRSCRGVNCQRPFSGHDVNDSAPTYFAPLKCATLADPAMPPGSHSIQNSCIGMSAFRQQRLLS